MYTKLNRQDKNSGGCMSVNGEVLSLFDSNELPMDLAIINQARKARVLEGTEQLRRQREESIPLPTEMLKRFGQFSLWGASSPENILQTP